MFQGTLTAIVTPFKPEPADQPAVDYDALEQLVAWQLECGINGLVVCGTTGESATLESAEKLAIAKQVIQWVRGRVPVIVGTGTNCTRSSIEMTRSVKQLKADAVLVVSPYYNKPTQEGLFEHFRHVAERGGLPVVVYNIPGRAVVEVSVATFERLSKVAGIVAVKQAVDSASRLVELAQAVGDRIALLAGDDPITYAVMTAGGKGVISASATVIPREMLAITEAALKGDYKEALEAQKRALPLINALFLETNPAPAKAALKLMGRIPHETLRLPMVPVTDKTRDVLRRYFTS